jgi:hypothetical protein
MDFENGIKAEDGQGQGSIYPQKVILKDGKLTLAIQLYTSDISAQLMEYWGAATGPNDTQRQESFPVESVFNSGDFGEMTVRFPNCYYSEVPATFKGSDPMEPNLAVKPELDQITLVDTLTIVQSPIYIKLQNLEPAYHL